MTDFRFSEAQLLKAGLPQSFVSTLRDLTKFVGGGLSVTDLNEAEALLLTNNQGRADANNLAAQVQMLEMRVAQISRQMLPLMGLQAQIEALQVRGASPVTAAQIAGLQAAIDALQIRQKPNLSALEQRIADLEALAHGGP